LGPRCPTCKLLPEPICCMKCQSFEGSHFTKDCTKLTDTLRDTKPLDHGHAPPTKGKSPPTPAGIEDLHQNLDTSTAPGRLSLIWTFLLLMQPRCQVRVYSGRGSGQVRTKTDEGRGQRFGQRLARAGVATDWIQRQGQRALIPCVGSGQVETETETDKGTGVVT